MKQEMQGQTSLDWRVFGCKPRRLLFSSAFYCSDGGVGVVGVKVKILRGAKRLARLRRARRCKICINALLKSPYAPTTEAQALSCNRRYERTIGHASRTRPMPRAIAFKKQGGKKEGEQEGEREGGG